MRRPPLMMNISALLSIIFYVQVGLSETAHRISSNDVSSFSRKRGSASDTWQIFHTDTSRSLAGSRLTPGPLTRLTTSSNIDSKGPSLAISETRDSSSNSSATAPDVRGNPSTQEQVSAPISRWNGASKRSTDAQTSLFSSEKTPQTGVVFMVSQQTANDAWTGDNPGASLASAETNQVDRCNCSSGAEGILDPDECDQKTGQCICLSGYTGLQCEDCEDGFFTNGTSGCMPCACDSFGAVNHLCDSSGICECKRGVYGPKCDECHPGFFHFSSTGCRPCQCHNHTSYCHPQSGVCLNCEGNTQGSNCEECRPGFYRSLQLGLTEACLPCPCSNATSSGTCHIDPSGSPKCDQCLPHYTGLHCDECSAGLYKSSKGCVPCDCSGNADPQGPAQICHPETGLCLQCINNTTGSRCHLCAPGFFGDAKGHNCTRPDVKLIPTTANRNISVTSPPSTSSPSPPNTSTTMTTTTLLPGSRSNGTFGTGLSTTVTTQTMLSSLSSPTDNTTAALTEVSWTQFNIIILAVIILVVVLLLAFVGGVYSYREYQNRKLNAPFWTIELKEDNISFSSYHDSIPNADVSGLLEDESNEVAPNGQLALTTQGNCYKV